MRRATLSRCALAALALALTSCDLLFAPMQERSNPLDPRAQLVTLTLFPEVDGTVLISSPLNESTLSVSSSQYAVLFFELSGLPDEVTSAVLTLECTSFVAQEIQLYPILMYWDAASIDSAEVQEDGFHTSAPAAARTVNSLGSWDFDLTAAVRAGMQYGLAMRGTMSGFTVFRSSGGGTQGPRLRIEGYNN